MMLVFKDTIVGLVASIQLSANNMLKIGDWIEMPGRNIDGTVTDVSLTTIKIRNFDNTISTVPPYALVTESFRNWRGMEESDGRRMIRSIFIDAKTIKLCSPQLLEKLKNISCCHDLVVGYEEQGLKGASDEISMLNHGFPTNLYLYRRYLEGYIKSHPEVNQELPLIVRLKQQVEYGIPIEIYCFLRDKSWVPYETTQSDIVDHALAALPIFELKPFQRMTSDDIRPVIGKP
jgi:miniconductance mechanosensitive channel